MENFILAKRPFEKTEQNIEKPHNKRRMVSADDLTRSDPLCLASVVDHIILEHLDDRSLLTGRLVCRSWNAKITSRDAVWKERCRRKYALLLNLNPEVSVFHRYAGLSHVYRGMLSGHSFQVDEHSKSETLDGLFGAGVTKHSRSLIRTFSPDWKWNYSFKTTFTCHKKLWIKGSTAVVSKGLGNEELVMVDLQTQKELWSHAGVLVSFHNPLSPHIHAVTSSGEVKLFDLDGECVLQLDTGGKLKYPDEMAVHPNYRFILVGLSNSGVHLVDVDNKQVIKLQLAFPEIPEDETDEPEDETDEPEDETEEDEDGYNYSIIQLGFLSDKSLGDGQLAVYVCRPRSLVVAIVDTKGAVLHQATKMFRLLISWTDTLEHNSPENEFIVAVGDRVEKYAVHCEETSGIQFQLVWQKAFCARFRAEWPVFTLLCGDHFLLGHNRLDLLVYRLDDGQLVSTVPNFFNTYFRSSSKRWTLTDVSGDSPEHIARRVQIARASYSTTQSTQQQMQVFIANTSWLNELSPATTKPDIPVLLFLSDTDTDIRYLRWSEDLWCGEDLELLKRGKIAAEVGLHQNFVTRICYDD